MTNSSLEKALQETWEKKEKFYHDTKNLSIMEILEKIEGRKFDCVKFKQELHDKTLKISAAKNLREYVDHVNKAAQTSSLHKTWACTTSKNEKRIAYNALFEHGRNEGGNGNNISRSAAQR